MKRISITTFKILLVLLGAFGIFMSIDFSVGGFRTLGWQGTTDFLTILDEIRYGIQDNHFRFLSGMLGALSLFMIFALTNLKKYQHTLNFIFALIFIGGLMRFTSGDFEILFGTEIGVALIAEIMVMPLLYLWLAWVVKTSE